MMFNLTVGEAHTFFVGDGQWLVHNACIIQQVGDDHFYASIAKALREQDWGVTPNGKPAVEGYFQSKLQIMKTRTANLRS